MVELIFDKKFKHLFSKIKDNSIKTKIKKQIQKINNNPEVGKPMRFGRKGSREVYIKPFRLSYIYFPEKNTIYILDIYHKDEQ
tara:strand:- start:346 stop:594 length:249 start_codon:yes stop_codon:yes gene_type:complete